MNKAALFLSLMLSADLGTGSPPVAVAPAPPAKQLSKNLGQLPAGWHTHVCNRCGTSWSHGHESFGNVAQHTCPKCGVVQWHKSPVIQLKVPCPPGVR